MLLTCKHLIHLELILILGGFFRFLFVSFLDFWPLRKACGILVPQLEIEPAPPAVESLVLTTGPPGKSLVLILESTVRQRFRGLLTRVTCSTRSLPFPGLPASKVTYQSPTYAFSCFQALFSILLVNLFIPVTDFQTREDF